MPGVLERRGEDLDLRWGRGWRCLGERERRWRGLGVEDGYGRRGEREGEVDMGKMAHLVASGGGGVVVAGAGAGGWVWAAGGTGSPAGRVGGGGGGRGAALACLAASGGAGAVVAGAGGGVQVQVQDDLPEAPAQPEGDPENEGLPTATRRLTRSRLERSKRAARGGTPSHRGPTLAEFRGGGPHVVWAGARGL